MLLLKGEDELGDPDHWYPPNNPAPLAAATEKTSKYGCPKTTHHNLNASRQRTHASLCSFHKKSIAMLACLSLRLSVAFNVYFRCGVPASPNTGIRRREDCLPNRVVPRSISRQGSATGARGYGSLRKKWMLSFWAPITDRSVRQSSSPAQEGPTGATPGERERRSAA